MKRAPLLILAVGNPSRGDDALGPTLLEKLHEAGVDGVDGEGDVELLTDFQLQVEHALDLRGRRAVLFVDAAWPAAAGQSAEPERVGGVSMTPIEADARVPPASHALRAQAVLHVAQRLNASVPPAWQLAIEGQSFELGAGLSAVAQEHLTTASAMTMRWLASQRESALPEHCHA